MKRKKNKNKITISHWRYSIEKVINAFVHNFIIATDAFQEVHMSIMSVFLFFLLFSFSSYLFLSILLCFIDLYIFFSSFWWQQSNKTKRKRAKICKKKKKISIINISSEFTSSRIWNHPYIVRSHVTVDDFRTNILIFFRHNHITGTHFNKTIFTLKKIVQFFTGWTT